MMRTGLLAAALTAALAACSSGDSAPITAPPPEPARQRIATPIMAPQQTPAEATVDAYVVNLQSALRHHGYYHGRIDGVCGAVTRIAIRRYEVDLGVPPRTSASCQVGGKVWEGLGLSPGGANHRQLHLN